MRRVISRRPLRGLLDHRVAVLSEPRPVPGPVPRRADRVTGSSLGVIRGWVDRDPRPPLEAATAWLGRMLLGPSGPAR